MADCIKIGSTSIKDFKVGNSNCKIYLGDKLLFGQPSISYTVDLESQWEESTSYGDISDASNYEFYQSYSNKGVQSSMAEMKIIITGYDSFSFKVRSYAEARYDFVTVLNIDDESTRSSWPTNPTAGTGTWASGYVKYNGKTANSSSVWNTVTFDDLGGGEHTIRIVYGKDYSTNSNDDRGYVAIPK